MKVNGIPGVRGSQEMVALMAERALDERKSIGTGVPDTGGLTIDLDIASLRGSNGRICGICNGTRAMHLYLFDITRESLGEAHGYDTDVIDTYVRWLGKLPCASERLRVSDVLADPENAIERYERGLENDELKRSGYPVGLPDYETVRDHVIRDASFVRDIMLDIMTDMLKAFPRKGRATVRHEMDHLEMIQNSELVKRYVRSLKAATDMEEKYANEERPADDAYRKAGRDLLDSLTETSPIFESRALFFSMVDPEEWKDADFGKVSEKVLDRYLRGYALKDTATEVMISLGKSLVGKTMSEKDLMYVMSRNTPYVTDDFDRKSVRSFLNVYYPAAIHMLTENAGLAAYAIGTAYGDDPSRLVRANGVDRFGAYVKACGGKSMFIKKT